MFREVSTGAADDLARVTDIARAMVLRYGMSEALGNVTYDRYRSPFLQPNFPVPQERNYSEGTAEAVDNAVRGLVDSAFEQAFTILQQNRALLDRTAEALLETETLNEPEIERVKEQSLPRRHSRPRQRFRPAPRRRRLDFPARVCGERPAGRRPQRSAELDHQRQQAR